MQQRTPSRPAPRKLDLAEPLDLATEEEIPELDADVASDGLEDLSLDGLEDEVFGDSEGNDYRAGTMDPDGSDRGPYRQLSADQLEAVPVRRPH